MAEIVNLRTVRKQKLKAQKEKTAEENRIRSGRTKAERLALETQRKRETSLHEAHRREQKPNDDIK